MNDRDDGQPGPQRSGCSPDCREHPEHVYILCYGKPTLVGDRDYLGDDPTLDYPITHYVGYTRQIPPVKRVRSHGARSAHYIAQIRPGTLEVELRIKIEESCPTCGQILWYYAESPTYPGDNTLPSEIARRLAAARAVRRGTGPRRDAKAP